MLASAAVEPYAVLSSDGKTVTFYYDENKASRGGIDINHSSSRNPYATVTTAVIDASFASYRPTITAYWFCNCDDLTSIKGMENLKTDNVTTMENMFYGCSGLTSLDVSGFNTDNVESMSYMFAGCSSLTTIYASEENWSTDKVTVSSQMFAVCTKLVGGNGTKYDANHTDKEYVRIDKPGAPGYFTDINAPQEDLKPISPDNGDIDFGGDDNPIDEDTDLDGNVVGNVYYNIAPGAGGYNPVEGCIEVTKPTSDEELDAMEGMDIFGEDFSKHFTGIIFKVPAGSGSITVCAETVGSMVLKVKIGKQEPFEMMFTSKNKIKIPYSVDKPTYVYIYAGVMDANAVRGNAKAANAASLKIYGIEWQQQTRPCDVNGDVVVDVGDIMAVINVMAGGVPGDSAAWSQADVNGDGSVDVGDIMAIINKMAQQ